MHKNISGGINMLSIHLDQRSGKPLYNQIYEQIREQILTGELTASTKLPSTRSMAGNLGVSRNTVDTAYYQLQSEGYIDAAPKSGFYVCALTPVDYRTKPAVPVPENTTGSTDTADASETQDKPAFLYDFDPYSIDISHFPFSVWRRLSRQVLMDNHSLFLLGDNRGDQALRSAICSYVRMSRQVTCTPDQVIVGAGVDYLLQMLSLVFQSSSMNNITLESPGYTQAAHIFHNNGLTVTPGTMDKSGLSTSSIAPESSIVYVTPSHQFPLGTVMPYGRRVELLTWAKSAPNRYIIEDDHDSEFRYRGKPIPALQGMDDENRVIYIGTFSKAIAPAIRVGYMILPPELLKRYEQICGHYSCTVSRVDQAILTHFLCEGYFEKHVNRMRKIYRSKHDLILECMQPLIDRYGLTLQGEHAGMHVTIFLPEHISEQSLIKNAAAQGIHLYGIESHYLPQHPEKLRQQAILLGYSALTEDEIKKGVHLMVDTHIFDQSSSSARFLS